ncbi:MAG: transcription elongation factor GreB [Bacteroidia bacterium]|jgi:transcription elongation factor GreB
MGRWRPPQIPSSPYITPQGAESLDSELKLLWNDTRPEVVRALTAAAAEGDRSENAEYIYRKKQLGEIDRRIRYISKRLDVVKIIDRLPEDRSVVRFGATVNLRDAAGNTLRYRIVGADETNAKRQWISIDSPVARQLLGKKEGNRIKVSLPEGTQQFTILKIEYQNF